MISRRQAVLAGLVALLPASGMAQTERPADVARVQAEVERIVAQFLAAGGDLTAGVSVSKVVIHFTPQLSWVDEDDAVHSVAWSQCPPEFQALFATWLGDAPQMEPSLFFSELFNAFLVPHEMSHLVDAERGAGDWTNGGRLYDTEVHANRVAVAFWLGQAGGPARLERFMSVVETVAATLPNPVPEGQDRVAYFQENYSALGSNPPAYGWYQFRMFLDAWALRNEKDFRTLLAQGPDPSTPIG